MVWGTTKFQGMQPRLPGRQLPTTAAAYASDCWLSQGIIKPMPEIRRVEPEQIFPSTTQTIYRFDETRWFAWNSDVDAVHAPVRLDVANRVIWTGDGAPKHTTEAIMRGGGFMSPGVPISRQLGVPPPEDPPTIALGALTSPDTDDIAESHAYVFTWLTDLDEEGPPSLPTQVVTREFNTDGTIQPVTITTPVVLQGSYGVNRKRIYRTLTGASGETTYHLLATLNITSPTYVDTTLGADLGDQLVSTLWDPPPEDLTGLIALPNGVLAGFRGRDIHFSEPYQPHAWPQDYIQTVESEVVGIDNFGTNVVVGTTGRPYLIAGNHPSQLTAIQMELNQSCVAKRGFAYVDQQGIVFASPDGLVLVGPDGGQIITRPYYDEETWRAESPEAFTAVYHDGHYVGFNGTRGVAIDPENNGVVYTTDNQAIAIVHDRPRDAIYMAARKPGETEYRLHEWDTEMQAGDTARRATWTSGIYAGPLRTFSAVQVIADSYSAGDVTLHMVNLEANQTVSRTFIDRFPLRLPHTDLAQAWYFSVRTRHVVQQVLIGSMPEMIGG